MIIISVEDQANVRKELRIEGPRAVIGKDGRCDVQLAGWRVSKRHAEIFFSNDRLFVRDLDSTFGTVMNEGKVLQAVSQVQQLGAVALQLAGQLRGRHALGEPAKDQDQFDGPTLDAMQGRAGEDVEHAPAVAAAEVQHRWPTAAVNGHTIGLMAARTGEPLRMQPLHQLAPA